MELESIGIEYGPNMGEYGLVADIHFVAFLVDDKIRTNRWSKINLSNFPTDVNIYPYKTSLCFDRGGVCVL
jgi:hypothetical protein